MTFYAKEYSIFVTEYVQSKMTVSRSVLVDVVNDKCANYRRKKKEIQN